MNLHRYISRILAIEPIKRHAIISLSTTILLTAVGYLSTIYFAQALGPAILGSYFLFLAYVGIFDLLGDGGFGGAVVKRISEGQEKDQYYSAFIFLRFILLFISLSVLAIIAPYIVDLNSSGLFSWLILALIAATFASITMNGIYGAGNVGIAQASNLCSTIIRILVQVIATFLGYAAGGLAGGFIVGTIAGFIINFRYVQLHLARFTMLHLKSLFSFSFWIFLAASGTLVFAYSDTILIGYFMTNADVGIYRVALQLTAAATFITGALHYVLYPKMSGWFTRGEVHTAEIALSKAFTYSLLLAVPVVAGGILLGDKLLVYFYGAEFESGVIALGILLFVQIVNVFMYLQTMCLNAIDQPRNSFIATAIAAGINIILNILFIPVMGISGAALATFISIALNALIAYTYLSRSISVKLEARSIVNIIIAASTMAFLVIIFRLITGIPTLFTLFITITAGAVVYLLILFKLDKSIKREIISLLSSIGIPWPFQGYFL
jgi:O-antigen/teichoic acid export membrane protein